MSRIPFRRKHLAVLTASILGLSVLAGCGSDGSNGTDGVAGTNGVDGAPGADGITNYSVPGLKRLATVPLGAEVTGLFLNSDGTLFMNVQHPADTNSAVDADGKTVNKGTVGYIAGQDFTALAQDFPALDLPILTSDQELPRVAVGQYKVLAQTGDLLVDGNKLGDILAADGTLLSSNNNPDFNGVISDGVGGFYLYTNWENRPGSMSRIHLDASYVPNLEGMLDFSGVKGTWVNCFGTVSPWGNPLTSEELYFDNTADWFATDATTGEPNSNAAAISAYLGYPVDGSGAWANPYRYGYIVELTNATDASEANVAPVKHFAMGRFSHENSVVMPDQRTVFLSDDGTGTVFFKFVADTAGDLSVGTLYGAKITQANGVTDPAEAALAIEWVELAHGDDTTIESWIAQYDTATVSSPSYITDAEIADWAEAKAGKDLNGDGAIASNPFGAGDDRPAFLESRKAAVALGATGEFRKMEGTNINYKRARDWYVDAVDDGNASNDSVAAPNGINPNAAYVYMAMSNINKTMSDAEGDIQLDAPASKCGAVYRMKLSVDTTTGLVDVDTMVPALVGGPYYADRSVNNCNVNNISEPDNIVPLEDGRVIIGEDTGQHENNMVWVYDDPAAE